MEYHRAISPQARPQSTDSGAAGLSPHAKADQRADPDPPRREARPGASPPGAVRHIAKYCAEPTAPGRGQSAQATRQVRRTLHDAAQAVDKLAESHARVPQGSPRVWWQ